jgi:hypothetical protein
MHVYIQIVKNERAREATEQTLAERAFGIHASVADAITKAESKLHPLPASNEGNMMDRIRYVCVYVCMYVCM